MAAPNCVKCGSNNITYQDRLFGGIYGVLVYCAACGAIISWAPKPKD